MRRKDADGKTIKGEFPKGVDSFVSYGPNLQSFITYLNTYLNNIKFDLLFKRLYFSHLINCTVL